jgi:hypothetical protein
VSNDEETDRGELDVELRHAKLLSVGFCWKYSNTVVSRISVEDMIEGDKKNIKGI